MERDDTLSLEVGKGARCEREQPSLFLILQCQSPLAVPSRHSLAQVDVVSIGRGPRRTGREGRTLAVTLPDSSISGQHAWLRRTSEGFVLEDAGSKNGSLVNGVPQTRVLLKGGDILQLGSTFFSYRFTPEGTAADYVPDLGSAPIGMTTLLPNLEQRFVKVKTLAQASVPIMILGESGTGKELVARAVHHFSRRTGELVAVNCGALPGTLVEAELFGHCKGAFSGALEHRAGLVRSSDRGTLFLDEVGDLPSAAQPALLRVLQEREVMPVGGHRAVPVDLRVVCATHRDLDALEAAGSFRADLRARLEGHVVRLMPLRERREDMGLLLATLLRRIAGPRADVITLSPEAGRAIVLGSWPLNIRQLEQRVAAALALGADELSAWELKSVSSAPGRPPAPGGPPAPSPVARALTPSDLSQRQQLAQLLERHAWNISAVARDLGKERIQIRRWIRRYGLAAEGDEA